MTECDGSGMAGIMEKAAAAGGRKRKFLLSESELSTNSSLDQFKARRLAVSTPHTPPSPRENELTVEFFATSAGNSVDFSDGNFHKHVEAPLDFGLPQLNAMNADSNYPSPRRVVKTSIIFRRERAPSSVVQADPGELAYESNSHHCSTMNKMPSHAEIEEFFAAAEKNLQKQFIDKYNYDIVKDEPTEGRYEWVRVNSTKAIMKKAKNGRH